MELVTIFCYCTISSQSFIIFVMDVKDVKLSFKNDLVGLEGLRMIWAMVGKLWVSSIFSFISLHTSELFPTTNRNTAVGMTLTMSQIGSMSAPLLVQLVCFYLIRYIIVIMSVHMYI